MEEKEKIKTAVRKRYGDLALKATGCCAPVTSCCSGEWSDTPPADMVAEAIGYSKEERSSAPEGANLGLGCGNPQAIASLEQGETVIDLGAGAGFDAFLAAKAVGPAGHVIGIDMTPEMINRARANARKAGVDNVEFRHGEIEAMPVDDNTADVIISNCVINLSPEKDKVFREAFRVLKSGGRLAVSDIVALQEIPEALKQEMALYTGCASGAARVDWIKSELASAGFTDIAIDISESSRELIRQWAPGRGVEDMVASASIRAVKP